MKRTKLLIITAAAVMLLAGVASAATSWGTFQGHPIVRILFDGKELKGDVPAIIMQSRTLVPFRLIAEAMGAEVEWNQETRTVEVNSRPLIIQAVTTKELRPSTVDDDYEVPDEIREEFALKDSPVVLYVQAWDDGKPHTWEATWTDQANRQVYKTSTLEVEKIDAVDGVPARVYLTDKFSLSAPLQFGQARLPGPGTYTVTVRRDGAVVAKVSFWFEG